MCSPSYYSVVADLVTPVQQITVKVTTGICVGIKCSLSTNGSLSRWFVKVFHIKHFGAASLFPSHYAVHIHSVSMFSFP